MRYRLIAKLEGELYCRESQSQAERDEFLFEILTDGEGKVNRVAVSMQVPAEKVSAFSGSMEPGEGPVKFSIRIGGDKEVHDRLVRQLQILESELAVASRGAVWRILWDTPDKEFLAESPAEQELLPVTGLSYSKKYPPTRAVISSHTLRRLVMDAPLNPSLQVTKSFWREGMNAFRTFQYVQAFYWFYFIIEDAFAGGKTGERGFVSQLHKSRSFSRIAEGSLRSVRADSRHRSRIDAFCAEEDLQPMPADLPALLFKCRGRLHHYSSRSSKSQPTPFNQEEFESMALLAMHIASTIVAGTSNVESTP